MHVYTKTYQPKQKTQKQYNTKKALSEEETLTCDIGGVMQPKIGNRHFHAFSFYYDRAIDMGLMTGEDSILKPGNFKTAAAEVCIFFSLLL